MVIDTSAVLAILHSSAVVSSTAIEASDSNRISVASFVETSIVIESRYGTEGLRDLD
jgi:ribonuclease VapC